MIKHTGIEIEEKGKVDRITLFLYLLFVVIGWFNIMLPAMIWRMQQDV